MDVGLVADTHAVFDPELSRALKDVACILHAGDVGHHGGHKEVLEQLESIASTLGVRGNVDTEAPEQRLPHFRLEEIGGWRICITHICGSPPSKEATKLAQENKADILVFGHSHKYSVETVDRVLFVNPGSAGPARFKLKRSAAILHLPAKSSGMQPSVRSIRLAAKAPPKNVRNSVQPVERVLSNKRAATSKAGGTGRGKRMQ